jgi:hypothetical protein
VSPNALLDRLPRRRVGRLGREAPAFRVCGEVGLHAGLIALLAAGLVRGASLAALALVAAVCVASFFAWAHVRRAVTGRETLVLLEHVWVALACSALALWALGEPVLATLDCLAVTLPVVVACGRIGCLLAGCCHGRPSSHGIVYSWGAYAGVRLLPVPLLEAAALVVIAAGAFAALPFAAPGAVLTWYLAAYAIVRFGLEGLRGDRRPELLGLSVNRWLCVGELAVALTLAEEEPAAGALLVLAALAAAVARRPWRWRGEAAAVRSLVATLAPVGDAPAVGRTPGGVAVAVSPSPDGGRHVSLSMPGPRDVRRLCELAAAIPGVDARGASLGDLALHVRVGDDAATGVSAEALHRAVALAEQAAAAAPARRAYFGLRS